MSGLLQKYLGDAVREIGDPSAPDWPSAVAKTYDNITMAQFLQQQGASQGAIELLEYPYASAEDDPVSFLWNLRENWYEVQEKTRYKISGGNDLLPKGFAAKLKENIHYGSPVVRIEQDSNKVRAIVVQSRTHHTFEADRLICTIPFPALRRVEIQPPFSERKRKAIAELRYDPVTRSTLQCRLGFGKRMATTDLGSPICPRRSFIPPSTSRGREDCWFPTCLSA